MPVVNEAEHRRGLVLGLTLAEVLLLLLFLILLALGARLSRLSKEIAEARERLQSTMTTLSPLMDELKRKGELTEDDVRSLIEKGSRAEKAENAARELTKRVQQLEETTAVLTELSPEVVKQLPKLKDSLQAASRLNPDDPPAFLKRAVDLIGRLGPDNASELVNSVADLRKEKDELSEKLRAAEAEKQQLLLQRANLMRSGRGTTYPSCWIDVEGKTQFIFDVTIFDGGLKVSDAGPPERAHDKVLQLVKPFPRRSSISPEQFRLATKDLHAWSVENQCRFFAKLRDSTGEHSKSQYKRLRTLVEGHFYILPVQDTAAVPTRGLPARGEHGEQIEADALSTLSTRP